jgi:hypothetical protein
MGWRAGVSPEIRQEPAISTLVRAEVTCEALAVRGVEWLRGSVVVLDEDEDEVGALEVAGKVRIEARPRLRSKRPNLLIGRRVCGVGEESCAVTVELAKMYVAEGAAEWVNRREVPHDWVAPRASDRDLLPLVAETDVVGISPLAPVRPKGTRFAAPREPALEAVASGLARPVGWQLPARTAAGKKKP